MKVAPANQLPAEHLQSYLLAFRGGVLSRPLLREFFGDVREVASKWGVVQTYEMGMTCASGRADLRREVGWSQEELGVSDATDLPLRQWKQLLGADFPFVKRVLVTGPQVADQRLAVEQTLRALDTGI